MKKIIFLLFAVSLIWGQQSSVLDNLKKILPEGLNINFYEESEVENFYVVNIANNQILYVSNDFKYVFAGDVISLIDGNPSSLNELYQAKLVQQVMTLLEDSKTINFTADNEKHVIKVFTDISCGYCRLLHSQIDDYLLLWVEESSKHLFVMRIFPIDSKHLLLILQNPTIIFAQQDFCKSHESLL